MTQQAHQELGAGRKLRLVDAVAQSVGFMGPVFSIAFLVPEVVGITSATGKGAGIAAPLAVLIAAVGVLGFGWIVAEYARRVHAAGSLYDYVSIGLGERVGGASGLLYYAGVLVLGAAILIMLGGTIHDTLLAEFNHPLLPELGWDIVLLVIVGLTVFFGVALSTRMQLVLAVISITVVAAFSIYVIVRVGSANDLGSTFTPSKSPQGTTGVLFGVLYGVLLFTGFETAANLGEETRQPGRDIPRAVLFSVLAITGFYLLGSYAQVAGFHFDLAAMGKAAGAPLFALASPASAGGYGSVTLLRLVELVVVFDMLAVLLGCATAGSRGLFAMARDGRLPAPLAAVSRRGTPLTAGIAVMAGYIIAVIVTTQWNSLWGVPGEPHYAAMFNVLATFGSFTLACVYFLLSLGAFRGLADHRNRYAVMLAAVVGMLVTGAAIFGAVYKVTAPLEYIPVPAAALFLIGLATRRKATVGQSLADRRQVATGTGTSDA
jgi:amino acid transporter